MSRLLWLFNFLINHSLSAPNPKVFFVSIVGIIREPTFHGRRTRYTYRAEWKVSSYTRRSGALATEHGKSENTKANKDPISFKIAMH